MECFERKGERAMLGTRRLSWFGDAVSMVSIYLTKRGFAGKKAHNSRKLQLSADACSLTLLHTFIFVLDESAW